MRPRSSQPSWPMIAPFALSVTKNTIFVAASSSLRCTSSSAVPIGLTLDSPNALRMMFPFAVALCHFLSCGMGSTGEYWLVLLCQACI